MSFQLPPEIIIQQEQHGEKFSYIFRHNTLGELGRLVLSEYMGQSHFSSEVTGDQYDPLTQKRREILEPLTKSVIAEVEKKLGKPPSDLVPSKNYDHGVPPSQATFEGHLLPCVKCEKTVAHIIYSRGTTSGETEDCYRMMYSKLKEVNLPTWIVGHENRLSGDVLVLKSWPERDKQASWVNGNNFDVMIKKIQNSHC